MIGFSKNYHALKIKINLFYCSSSFVFNRDSLNFRLGRPRISFNLALHLEIHSLTINFLELLRTQIKGLLYCIVTIFIVLYLNKE
jgi:hypothetical protein